MDRFLLKREAVKDYSDPEVNTDSVMLLLPSENDTKTQSEENIMAFFSNKHPVLQVCLPLLIRRI